jgi:hypothetical protein
MTLWLLANGSLRTKTRFSLWCNTDRWGFSHILCILFVVFPEHMHYISTQTCKIANRADFFTQRTVVVFTLCVKYVPCEGGIELLSFIGIFARLRCQSRCDRCYFVSCDGEGTAVVWASGYVVKRTNISAFLVVSVGSPNFGPALHVEIRMTSSNGEHLEHFGVT